MLRGKSAFGWWCLGVVVFRVGDIWRWRCFGVVVLRGGGASGLWSVCVVRVKGGCAQGCTFCATGRMGLMKQLTTDEILIQLYYAKKETTIYSN